MKLKKLHQCLDEQLVGIYASLDYILDVDEKESILSRTDKVIIKNWQRQINIIL